MMRAISLAFPVLLAGCISSTEPRILGQWGGPTASLELTASGGTLGYQCGAGTIDPGWSLSPDGRFSATGQHYTGGGPVPSQGRPPHPAQYRGLLDGDRLTLTVTVPDLQAALGPFTLIRGGSVVHEICV